MHTPDLHLLVNVHVHVCATFAKAHDAEERVHNYVHKHNTHAPYVCNYRHFAIRYVDDVD